MPKTALTVGVGTVMDARSVMLMVNGHNKARALRHGVEGGISQMWTISALQMHPNAIIVADDDACAELKVQTYRYFKDIERENLDPASQLGWYHPVCVPPIKHRRCVDIQGLTQRRYFICGGNVWLAPARKPYCSEAGPWVAMAPVAGSKITKMGALRSVNELGARP